jgi:hypothetical protein
VELLPAGKTLKHVTISPPGKISACGDCSIKSALYACLVPCCIVRDTAQLVKDGLAADDVDDPGGFVGVCTHYPAIPCTTSAVGCMVGGGVSAVLQSAWPSLFCCLLPLATYFVGHDNRKAMDSSSEAGVEPNPLCLVFCHPCAAAKLYHWVSDRQYEPPGQYHTQKPPSLHPCKLILIGTFWDDFWSRLRGAPTMNFAEDMNPPPNSPLPRFGTISCMVQADESPRGTQVLSM